MDRWNIALILLLAGLLIATGWRIMEEREAQAVCDGLASIPRVAFR